MLCLQRPLSYTRLLAWHLEGDLVLGLKWDAGCGLV